MVHHCIAQICVGEEEPMQSKACTSFVLFLCDVFDVQIQNLTVQLFIFIKRLKKNSTVIRLIKIGP